MHSLTIEPQALLDELRVCLVPCRYHEHVNPVPAASTISLVILHLIPRMKHSNGGACIVVFGRYSDGLIPGLGPGGGRGAGPLQDRVKPEPGGGLDERDVEDDGRKAVPQNKDIFFCAGIVWMGGFGHGIEAGGFKGREVEVVTTVLRRKPRDDERCCCIIIIKFPTIFKLLM